VEPDAFVLPAIGGRGPWSRAYLRNPGINNHDISIIKNFPFGLDGKQYAQLRVEMFNAFNHTQFSAVNIGTNLVVAPGVADRDVFRSYSQVLITDNLRSMHPELADRPYGQFFGEYNRAREPRVIQLGLKIYF
jgi:hypothetical protein